MIRSLTEAFKRVTAVIITLNNITTVLITVGMGIPTGGSISQTLALIMVINCRGGKGNRAAELTEQ